jgi:SAM-dependent methyltransferase
MALYKIGFIKTMKAWIGYCSEYKQFKKQIGTDNNFIIWWKYPCFVDKYSNGGTSKGAYFYQDLLVARRVFENNPKIHVDVGSRIDGFVAHVASFRIINIVDIRPVENSIKNIKFTQQDFMAPLKDHMIESCDSLSCLHALEHFGLGRYGDPVNYNGHIIGMENLYKMLKSGGKLYFSVPIGLPQRIEFHAHRIFSVKYLLDKFDGKYHIDAFSYVDDKEMLHENVHLNRSDIEENYGVKGDGANKGCGIFEMTKL